jgi:hypothetical protein
MKQSIRDMPSWTQCQPGSPLDMRASPDKALARVVAGFGWARPHCAYLFVNRRGNRMKALILTAWASGCARGGSTGAGFTGPSPGGVIVWHCRTASCKPWCRGCPGIVWAKKGSSPCCNHTPKHETIPLTEHCAGRRVHPQAVGSLAYWLNDAIRTSSNSPPTSYGNWPQRCPLT